MAGVGHDIKVEPIYTLAPIAPFGLVGEGKGRAPYKGPEDFDVKNTRVWRLTKWEIGNIHKEPSETYLISASTCSCPSPNNPCKHQTIRTAIISAAIGAGCYVWQLAYESGRVFRLSDL